MQTEIINFAKQLISIPSISGEEKKIFDFLEAHFNGQNSEVFREKTWVAEKFSRNLETTKKKAILLAGHADTVVTGNLEDWGQNPFAPSIHEEKLFGLGAADMKTSLATEIIAGENFAKNSSHDFDLWIVATANEEVDGQGSADFAKWFSEHADYEEAFCLIGDGGLKTIELGQRGNRFMRLSFTGVSGHGSQQENFAKSGLAQANQFLSEIDQIYRSLESYSHPILGRPSFVPTGITAGDAKSPNKTAQIAELILDIRTTPALEKDFANFITELSRKYHFTYENIYQPVKSVLIDSSQGEAQELLAISGAKFGVSPGATDQGFFVEYQIPTVVFGAANIAQFHMVDEFIELKNVEKFAKILLGFLAKI